MKKKRIAAIIAAVLAVTALPATALAEEAEKNDAPVEVTLNEVAHSIFYAPQYVAIEEGYFEDEGVKLTLVTGFGVI